MKSLNGSLLIGIITSLVAAVAGYLILSRLVASGLSSDTWLAPSVFAVQDSGTVDPFSVNTPTNATAEAIRENLVGKLAGFAGAAMAITFACSAFWSMWWFARGGKARGPEDSASGRNLWYILFLIVFATIVSLAVYAEMKTPIGSDLNAMGKSIVSISFLVTSIVLYWFATGWPTPNALRPSIPASQFLPLHR